MEVTLHVFKVVLIVFHGITKSIFNNRSGLRVWGVGGSGDSNRKPLIKNRLKGIRTSGCSKVF